MSNNSLLHTFFGPVLHLSRSLQTLTPAPSVASTGKPWLDVSSPTLEHSVGPASFPGDETKNLIGIPFAPEPSTSTIYWPVRTTLERSVSYWDESGSKVGKPDRAFGAARTRNKKHPKRLHAGVDLNGNHHDVVVAIEAGTVLSYRHFYEGVWRCLVDHYDYVINYGEIEGVRFCSRTKAVKEVIKDSEGKVVKDKNGKDKKKVVRAKCPGSSCSETCKTSKGKHANQYVVHETYTNKAGTKRELYTVRKTGPDAPPETLQTIADSFFGVTVAKLEEANPDVKSTPKPGTLITIPPALAVGEKVYAGQPLGEIGRMKKSSMLHFEMYDKDIEHTHSWWDGEFSIRTSAKRHRQDKSKDEEDETKNKHAFKRWVKRTASKAWRKPPNRVNKKGETGKTKLKPEAIYLDPTKYLIYLAKHAK